MSPLTDERRQSDKYPKEVKQWIESAAEAGAERAIDKLYAEIGKTGVRKAALILGALLLGLLSWFGFTGHLPPPK